jgi:hypothetical protein
MEQGPILRLNFVLTAFVRMQSLYTGSNEVVTTMTLSDKITWDHPGLAAGGRAVFSNDD